MKEQITKDTKEIFKKHPEEKYRKVLIQRDVKFPITNFIDFKTYQKSTNKNIKLQTYMFLPEESDSSDYKGILYMFHGMGAYGDSDAFIAKRFADKGLVVVTFDQRGHGHSEGTTGDIEDFSYIIKDAKSFIFETENYFKSKFKEEKIDIREKKLSFLNKRFACGISMGGLLSFYLSLEDSHFFRGVMLFCPAFAVHKSYLKPLISCVSSCCPTFKLPRPTKESEICKNPYHFENPDPVVFKTRICLRTVNTTVDYMYKAHKEFVNYQAPYVLIIPGVDKLVPPLKMYEFFEKSKSLDKDCWYYSNMWHAAYIEEEIFDILKKLEKWVDDRL